MAEAGNVPVVKRSLVSEAREQPASAAAQSAA